MKEAMLMTERERERERWSHGQINDVLHTTDSVPIRIWLNTNRDVANDAALSFQCPLLLSTKNHH